MAEGAEVKIKSLKKMMDVLNCFIEKQPLGVTEISEKLGLYKSNVHNILSTMVSMDYLEQDKISGKYYLGIGVVRLSRAVGNRFSFHNAALYHMQAISHEAGEIVYLSVPMKRMIYYLDAILPERVYYLNYSGRFVSNYRDSTEMMHCTASGKAMLATMCKADQEEYLSKPLDACTPHSITDPDVLRCSCKDKGTGLRRRRRRGRRGPALHSRAHPLAGGRPPGCHQHKRPQGTDDSGYSSKIL